MNDAAGPPPGGGSDGSMDLDTLRAERDYYRQVARQTGRKALADFAEMSRLIVALRQTEEALRRSGDDLERTVEERTADVVRTNAVLRAEIEERSRAEAAARESEERYRLLMETSPDAITVVDAAGAIIMVNGRALALYGNAVDEVIGHPFTEWVPPDQREQALGAFGQVLGGAVLTDFTLELQRKSGERFWASINASVVTDAGGAPRFAIIVSTDITARKRAEAELLKTQKLESLGILAGGIAHDFNNLLAAILGNIELGVELTDEAELRECLTAARSASLRARDLTQQLLTFARGGLPVRKRVSVAKVLAEAAQLGLRGTPVGCELDVPDSLWAVDADEGQLVQVINNLLINAVQAMPGGGTVTVRAENVVVEPGAGRLAGGHYLRITVADTGSGIAQGDLLRIFDPYFTTKATGSGLGLAVAYAVVKNHHGSIEVTSDVGVGTVFTVHLPACDGAAESAASPSEPPEGRPGKVLVMDDDPAVLDVAARTLRRIGCATVTVSDGAAAVAEYQRAADAGQPYDLLVVDLTIPAGMGGLEAFSRIRQRYPDAAAIVFSGYSEDPILAEYERHGFSAALAKPFGVEAMRRAVVRALADADTRRRLGAGR